ncbi:ribose transport system substrate-binding protein [Arthrobacter pascens]|uniref:ABC transporter substrate-binding protein n=1 Tax=Arthrobacter pascens TaxID=1677 RepID=UPI002793331D|nr:ABC transporter substrate-binding protein [Arthrobacter pascens]MDQ0680993.1 ribose transport system substrate-binding protein [Arthrobacter pascens]
MNKSTFDRRSFLTLSGLALGVVAIAGCEAPAGTPGASAPGGAKQYIAIVSKGFQHQFWQAVKQGADKAAKEFDVEVSFEGPNTEKDVDQQIQMLTTALGKSPAAIGFAALDSQAATPLLEQAKSKNIPVIAFDSGVDSDIPVTTASTDNKAAAAEAAKHLAELIGGSGDIAIIGHDQTSKSGTDRRDGFKEYIEKNHPNVKIVAIQYAGGDQLLSADAAKAIVTANPNLKGMYGTNEGSAIGVVKAVEELGLKGKLTIVGFDSGKAQIDAIRSGLMAGAVTQNPVGIGYETVKAAVAAIKGDKVEKVVDTGFYWYDAKNIDSDEIKPNLYQ